MSDDSYYKVIDGKKYDKGMLTIAEESVAGQGDGRISKADAEKLLAAVKDGNNYTDTEKDTMAYIREKFHFTDEADDWFRKEIRKWAGTKDSGGSYYKVIAGKRFDREMLEVAEVATAGQGDGRISKADAEKLLAAVKDGNSYTDVEKATMAHIRDNYKFTDEADKWFRDEIRKWAASK